MLAALKSRVRAKLWAMLQPDVMPEVPRAALGIDLYQHLPIHFDPPECPLCTYPEGVCHDCQGSLSDPAAPFTYGVESATVTHLHLHTIPDTRNPIRIPVRRKLCLRCFRIDWAKAHPGVPCDL